MSDKAQQLTPEQQAAFIKLQELGVQMLGLAHEAGGVEVVCTLWHPETGASLDVFHMLEKTPMHYAQVLAASSKGLREAAIKFSHMKELPKPPSSTKIIH